MGRDRPAVGEEVSLDVTVTDEMLVDLGGRRIHPVYATASMVLHMEQAARMLVEPHFGPGEDAVGYEISATHERPARVGDRLRVLARVTAVDERSCRTEQEVLGPDGRVGRGTMVQRYIEKGALERRSER